MNRWFYYCCWCLAGALLGVQPALAAQIRNGCYITEANDYICDGTNTFSGFPAPEAPQAVGAFATPPTVSQELYQDFLHRMAQADETLQQLIDMNQDFNSAMLPPGECAQPPVLNNPRVVTVSPNGGNYFFGDNEDAIIRFPDQPVTGTIGIFGGRNIHMIGGTIDLLDGSKRAVSFNNRTSNGEVFVEGMNIDVNNFCDVFALRNQRGAQLNFTFQNIFAYGPGYNQVEDCHGDLIQFQYGNPNGGFNLRVENFTGYTGGQGFFLPHRQNGRTSVAMRNVNVDYVPDPWRGGLTGFYFHTEHPNDRARYPVNLDNVYLDWMKPDRHIGPWNGQGRIDVSPTESRFTPESMITGSIFGGKPNGGDFVVPSQVGTNYDRSNFCTN